MYSKKILFLLKKPGYKITYNSEKFSGRGGRYHNKRDKLYMVLKVIESTQEKKNKVLKSWLT